MDDLDQRLIAELRVNARASVPTLAAILGVARGTVQARLNRLVAAGVIAGFTIKLRENRPDAMVRGVMMIELEGRNRRGIAAPQSGFCGRAHVISNAGSALISSARRGAMSR